MTPIIDSIQRADNAGRVKLTAVTIFANWQRHQFFIELEHNSRGEAILPQSVLDKLLVQARVQRGQTYSVA